MLKYKALEVFYCEIFKIFKDTLRALNGYWVESLWLGI